MKSKDMKQPSLKAIYESIDEENNTGFNNSDLKEIARSHRLGERSKPMTYDELTEEMDTWEREADEAAYNARKRRTR